MNCGQLRTLNIIIHWYYSFFKPFCLKTFFCSQGPLATTGKQRVFGYLRLNSYNIVKLRLFSIERVFKNLLISFHGKNMKVIVLCCFQNLLNKAIFMDFCTENDKMQLWLICSLIQLSKVAEAWIFFSFFPYSPIPNTHDTIMTGISSETFFVNFCLHFLDSDRFEYPN